MPLDDADIAHRERCYGCYRPQSQCFCDLIPAIDNRTEVLILQHTRERFHAFNTARIVHKALCRSRMEVGFTPDLARLGPAISQNVGLLYPGEEARLINEVEAVDRPGQIVVLDGTWHHAKTMVRDIPWLRELPRYRIAPASPSRYRIRREPTIEALSTVEATVDFLRACEPETKGFDDLLTAFNTMIDRHIDVIGTAQPRHRMRSVETNRLATNIPRSLLGDADNIVIAYGEAIPSQPDAAGTNVPLVWAAQRLGTGELFHATIEPPYPLHGIVDSVLDHMQLTQSDLEKAVTLTDCAQRWMQFVGEADTVFVYNKGTRRLLRTLSVDMVSCELLRSIDFGAKATTLAELLRLLHITPEPAALSSRAGRRLANAVSLVRHVREET